jgi:arginine/lysine/ornithine decarboxylase
MTVDTPIRDFIRNYAECDPLRLHMPGHKGVGPLGVEALDITEIFGADSLYEAEGIIAQSEKNASGHFGCPTYYSAEGSSQCIRAMVHLAGLFARRQGKNLKIAAARNVHRTFLSAVALLDAQVAWLYPREAGSYLSCAITPSELDNFLEREKPTAVYLTSPDYLGNMSDIGALAPVCRRHGALLLVDNAHGAYLRFLQPSRHPMDLGADLCCDSAHKTLPVLTGGAYLHAGAQFSPAQVRSALALFGSTSPSYLILQSLDAANDYLTQYPKMLAAFIPRVQALKATLAADGWQLCGQEPLKITLLPKSRGYTGTDLAQILRHSGIEPEFSDPDHLVLMLTPQISADSLALLEQILLLIPRRESIADLPPAPGEGEPVLSIREAMLSPGEEVPVEESVGRILADPSVGCPPAVPIVVCGERIGKQILDRFLYYGIRRVCVVAEPQNA